MPFLLASLGALIAACGSKGGVCIPNATQTCLCGPNQGGAQTCNADGASYSVCSCNGEGGGSGAGAGTSTGSGGGGACAGIGARATAALPASGNSDCQAQGGTTCGPGLDCCCTKGEQCLTSPLQSGLQCGYCVPPTDNYVVPCGDASATPGYPPVPWYCPANTVCFMNPNNIGSSPLGCCPSGKTCTKVTSNGCASTSSSSGGGSACPAIAPVAGSHCTGPLECTFGSSVLLACRDVYQCGSSGVWSAYAPPCPAPAPGTCNASQPGAGTVCTTMGATCTYGDTICVCDPCASGPCLPSPTTWTCAPPQTALGCPSLLPNEGAPCTAAGVVCTYGFPCSNGGSGEDAGAGAFVACTNGAWRYGAGGCAG